MSAVSTGTWLRGTFTAVIAVVSVWWLFLVATKLGSAPVKDSDGNIVLDEYQRAKDVLLVVLPLLTTTFGYWFGAQGRENAEARANQAVNETAAVVKATGDPQVLQKARELYPDAFK